MGDDRDQSGGGRGVGASDPLRCILEYHQRSKHGLHRSARSPGRLDWANQPDPFRTYAGAPAVDLPLLADDLDTAYDDLYRPGAVSQRAVDLGGVAILFELALGLSAWKEYRGERWALRCNPSSGNLHPTEGYAVVPDLPGLPAGVYHYVSRDHRLERRCTLSRAGASRLAAILPRDSFLFGLSTIAWREAWKYGERAFRYCQLDAGHALAACRYAAAVLGWSAVLLDEPADSALDAWLGLDRDGDFTGLDPADREFAVAAVLVGLGRLRPHEIDWSQLAAVLRAGSWSGRANPLSAAHVPWPVLDDVAEATRKPATAPTEAIAAEDLPGAAPSAAGRSPAATLIRQRRSALGLDGRTAISSATFYAMLDRLLPRSGVPPWDLLPWGPRIHLAVFVHRVEGLAPGFYAFERSTAVHDRLLAATRARFAWARPPGCPDHLRVFLLAERDLRDVSRIAGCHQEIAADGAFSLAMIAKFGGVLRARGPWWYRYLHWEAGVLGQVLYLEAEAAGIRGTGMGCYFDDVVHELLGLTDHQFQDLYHFTVGGPVEDRRLTSWPPYGHLPRGTGQQGARPT
ncbi:MAG TPA: SagB/ThcOx family dehydrogenase [Isosphaeraceae bacterium]|nr:SagB/ThcOx family dehydrogenase [Isosphaeraceae bacterium]